jgi:hypothetical protein
MPMADSKRLEKNYWDTCAPVVSWMSVRLMLVLTLAKKVESRSIDFTLAYSQAGLNINIVPTVARQLI